MSCIDRLERWLEAERQAEGILERTRQRYPFAVGKRGDFASAVTLPRFLLGAGTSTTSTTETILFASQLTASGVAVAGSADGQGGFWYPGKTLRMWVSGFLTTIGTAGTVTLNWRLNSISGNSLGASVAITPIVSITKGAWIFEGRITCRSIGSAGTLIGAGQIAFGSTVVTATSPGRTWLMPDVNSDATATIDTTASAGNSIVFTILQTQAHTWQAQMGGVEVLN